MGPRLHAQKTDTDDLSAEPSDVRMLEPNELVITLWRARGLLIMDKKVLGSGGYQRSFGAISSRCRPNSNKHDETEDVRS